MDGDAFVCDAHNQLMSLGKGKILACVSFEDVCNRSATSCRHPHVIVVAGCSVVEQEVEEEVIGRIKLSLLKAVACQENYC